MKNVETNMWLIVSFLSINTELDFHRANVPAISEALTNVNWNESSLRGCDVNESVNCILMEILTEFTPRTLLVDE